MIVRADYEYGDEIPMLGGEAGALLYPEDVSMFTDEERDRWRAELAAKEARRRQPGFTAAWPRVDEDERRLRLA